MLDFTRPKGQGFVELNRNVTQERIERIDPENTAAARKSPRLGILVLLGARDIELRDQLLAHAGAILSGIAPEGQAAAGNVDHHALRQRCSGVFGKQNSPLITQPWFYSSVVG